MTIGVIHRPHALSDYIVEMLRAWGVISITTGDTFDPAVTPTIIVPAADDIDDAAVLHYVERGGTAICFMPNEKLARAAGLTPRRERDLPLNLRFATIAPGGFAGESPPIVGRAVDYAYGEDVQPCAYMYHPDQFASESPAIVSAAIGRGRLICFAFDLPRCVLMLRQGDPALEEFVPQGESHARPSHMASRTARHDAGWMPYADLLARLLIDLAHPMAMWSHLPGEAPGILLYSGDEDVADPAFTNDELDWLTANNARMDLYIIPDATSTSRADADRMAQHHDLGPHPNLRSLDGKPIDERLAHLEQQIKQFADMYGRPPLTMRTHCTAWAGYMQFVEVLERCGVRMDSSYFSGFYGLARDFSPYGAFGASMPMRFCRPDGSMLNVFEQHTHISDDMWFAPDAGTYRNTTYSYRLAPDTFALIAARTFDDIAHRLHTPYAVCIHPSNWGRFSRQQGQMLVTEATRRGMPTWSFTQWSKFVGALRSWSVDRTTATSMSLTGGTYHPDMRLAFATATHRRVRINGHNASANVVRRFGRDVAMVRLPQADKYAIEWETQS
jgi:hypothetical protein